MKKKGGGYISVFFALLGLTCLILSLTFRDWEAMTLPAALSGLLFIAAAFESFREYTKKPPPVKDEPAASQGEVRSERHAGLWLTGWIISFIIAIYVLGFLLAIPLFAVLYLKWRKRKWLVALTFALAADGIIYLVFEVVLRTELYRGLIFGG